MTSGKLAKAAIFIDYDKVDQVEREEQELDSIIQSSHNEEPGEEDTLAG
jgi:hypothetical protein